MNMYFKALSLEFEFASPPVMNWFMQKFSLNNLASLPQAKKHTFEADWQF